jgi:hypothetical protein
MAHSAAERYVMRVKVTRQRIVSESFEMDIDPDDVNEAGFDSDDDEQVTEYVLQEVEPHYGNLYDTDGWEDVDEPSAEVISYN